MSEHTEKAVIFLHHIKIGDLLYCGPSEVRAWMRECHGDGPRRELVEAPVQRGSPPAHVNGMAQPRARSRDTDR